jgi:hypothetical protein
VPPALAAIVFGFGIVCSLAQAAAANGTRKFNRSADYDGRVPSGLVSRYDTIVVRDGEGRFSADCAVRFRAEDFSFSDVFNRLRRRM